MKTDIKIRNKAEYKILNKGTYSPLNKSLNKNEKINFFTEKRNKTPKKNVNICLTNTKFDEFSFNNKTNKNKKENSKNRNKYTDYNFKTFYIDKSYIKSKINSINENRNESKAKNKSFLLKRNKSFNNQINHKNKSSSKNNNKSNNHRRSSNIKNKCEEGFNTFNNTYSNKKEINSYSFFKMNNSTNKNNNKNKLEKKQRVDTLEYLTKIINSIKPKNLTNKQNEIINNNDYNNKNETCINIFRKKNNEKKKISTEKSDIQKYIQVKKKLYKLDNIKKKKKEKEEELKKYLELYKLQKNISNLNNNNSFYHSTKTQNIFNINKQEENNNNNYIFSNNNNDYLSSIDSTIVDKNNFYQGIIDIQKIYSSNIINNNIIINNYPHAHDDSNHENIKKINSNKKKSDDKKIHQKNQKIISRKPKENKVDNDTKINEVIFNNKIINPKVELKEEKIAEINFSYPSPRIEEDKQVEEKENKNEIIKLEDNTDKTNELQINEINEYSFKLNTSHSYSNEAIENNEINSITTSKFFNSQLLSEQNRQSNKNILLDEKELKEENKENTTEKNKKYDFTKEELDNYREILSSLFEYLKLITQRNALNDIISYGDMKYKYKIGFEIILTLIKLAPFNIIRAIQQTQYYHFAFRQLFIPYITKCFHKLKIFCSYDKLFEKAEKRLKFIYKKIGIKKIKQFKQTKNLDEINEILNIDNKTFELVSDKDIDISESKENDLIDWEDSFFSDKQDNNN